jgi:hypothetical protein
MMVAVVAALVCAVVLAVALAAAIGHRLGVHDERARQTKRAEQLTRVHLALEQQVARRTPYDWDEAAP